MSEKQRARLGKLKVWQRAILWVLEAKSSIELDDSELIPVTYEVLAGEHFAKIYKDAEEQLPRFVEMVKREWLTIKDSWFNCSRNWDYAERYRRFDALIASCNVYQDYFNEVEQPLRQRRSSKAPKPTVEQKPQENSSKAPKTNVEQKPQENSSKAPKPNVEQKPQENSSKAPKPNVEQKPIESPKPIIEQKTQHQPAQQFELPPILFLLLGILCFLLLVISIQLFFISQTFN
jgi:hypothetical protein